MTNLIQFSDSRSHECQRISQLTNEFFSLDSTADNRFQSFLTTTSTKAMFAVLVVITILLVILQWTFRMKYDVI